MHCAPNDCASSDWMPTESDCCRSGMFYRDFVVSLCWGTKMEKGSLEMYIKLSTPLIYLGMKGTKAPMVNIAMNKEGSA